MRSIKAVPYGLSWLLVSLCVAMPALAQAPAPKIDGFDVEQARRLTPGSALPFTLYGTPGGTASAHITGVSTRVVLDEVEAGVYEGTYTIRRGDTIGDTTPVTANLRLGNQIAASMLDESLLAGARPPATPAAAAAAPAPRIDVFEVDPAPRLVSGEQLFFTVRGSPAARTSVRIAGVKGKVSLEEVQSGRYEGAYTIKDRDRVKPNAAVTATLLLGARNASATLGQPLLAASASASPVRRTARACANCGAVEAINVVEVKGDGSYVGKVAGGVLGGLLGSQVGAGRGTTMAEIAGAVGGAVVGNEVERRVKKTVHYDVVTRLQGGGAQTVSYATEPPFRVGDKVRVEGGLVVRDE